jgi:hypothetical protein
MQARKRNPTRTVWISVIRGGSDCLSANSLLHFGGGVSGAVLAAAGASLRAAGWSKFAGGPGDRQRLDGRRPDNIPARSEARRAQGRVA